MSNAEQDQITGAMAERIRKAKELLSMTAQGTQATVQSTAETVAAEAAQRAEAADKAAEEVAEALGAAVTQAVRGAAHGTGAMTGGLMGLASGLLMAAQIGSSAALDAVKNLAASSAKAAGELAEGFLLALEDQEAGAERVKKTAKTLAQETFDATTGAALGMLGGAATAAGAVLGGAKGVTAGTVEALKQFADAGADATYVVGKETAEASTQVLRRALRRSEAGDR